MPLRTPEKEKEFKLELYAENVAPNKNCSSVLCICLIQSQNPHTHNLSLRTALNGHTKVSGHILACQIYWNPTSRQGHAVGTVQDIECM